MFSLKCTTCHNKNTFLGGLVLKCQTISCKVLDFSFFLKKLIYLRERARERKQEEGRREGERLSGRPCAEHRAPHRAWSHNPKITTSEITAWAESKSQALHWLSYPDVPDICSFLSNMYYRHSFTLFYKDLIPLLIIYLYPQYLIPLLPSFYNKNSSLNDIYLCHLAGIYTLLKN